MKLTELFDRIRALPPLPELVHQVLQRLGEDDFSEHELAGLIARDGALCAKLLRVANSARYQLQQQVGSVLQAIQLLGLGNVRTLVIHQGLISGFAQIPRPLHHSHWRHSLYSAALARTLAVQPRLDADLGSTLALVHGVGSLALRLAHPELAAALDQRLSPQHPQRPQLERDTLGYAFTEVSAELVRLWQFPPVFGRVLQDCTEPEECALAPAERRLVALVHVSAWLAWAHLETRLTRPELGALPLASAALLGLPQDPQMLAVPSLDSLCPDLGLWLA